LPAAPWPMGDSLAVELPALDRAALVRIQVPQPLCRRLPGFKARSLRMSSYEVIQAPRAEESLVAYLMTLAFSSDPVARWAWPDPKIYTREFPEFTRLYGGKAFDHGGTPIASVAGNPNTAATISPTSSARSSGPARQTTRRPGSAPTDVRGDPAPRRCPPMRCSASSCARLPTPTMTDDLPTAGSMLPQAGWLCVLIWCKSCRHQAPADLQAPSSAADDRRRAVRKASTRLAGTCAPRTWKTKRARRAVSAYCLVRRQDCAGARYPFLPRYLMRLLPLLLTLLLGGCLSLSSSNPPPPSHTTVVVPPGSTAVCPNGTAPPC
jgi:hypothetical protein